MLILVMNGDVQSMGEKCIYINFLFKYYFLQQEIR